MALQITHLDGSLYNFGVGWLVHLREKGDLYIDPPFQRGSVWTQAQKQAWIETLIDDLPRPTFFVNQPEDALAPYDGRATVIDGRQRCEAIFDFLDDKLEVRGELYSAQDDVFKRRLNMVVSFPVVLTRFTTEKQCVELYVRLLRCGTAHTEEDISRAQEMLKVEKEG